MKKTNKEYAIKEIQKVKIIDKGYEEYVINECNLLSKLKHPLITNMHYAFQDYEKLYMIFDLYKGGDLRSLIHSRKERLSENECKFIAASILIVFDYIHMYNIIHRDIKPENLVFDENGYLYVTDFGISKKYNKYLEPDKTGTLEYMSPEVLFEKKYNFLVDYYSLGIVLYELMFGYRPYNGRNRDNLKEIILSKQVSITNFTLPYNWTCEGGDFINKCIQRKPKDRMGFISYDQAKNHPWFKEYPWKNHFLKKIESPIKIKQDEAFNRITKRGSYVEKVGLLAKERYTKYMKDITFQTRFNKFLDYNDEQINEVEQNNKSKDEKAYDEKCKDKENNADDFSFTSNNINLLKNKENLKNNNEEDINTEINIKLNKINNKNQFINKSQSSNRVNYPIIKNNIKVKENDINIYSKDTLYNSNIKSNSNSYLIDSSNLYKNNLIQKQVFKNSYIKDKNISTKRIRFLNSSQVEIMKNINSSEINDYVYK